MIEAKNVVKSFDGFRALDGLTMTVPHGSIYGLVGPNGAGKSTLLRHVTGVYRQDSGSVLIEGNPVYENPAAKSRIASIPDELYYFLSASTRDMMRFYRGFYPRFDVKRYEALKDVFTTIPEKQPIRRLSKGMQKQSAFWLALCCQPEGLVLEPGRLYLGRTNEFTRTDKYIPMLEGRSSTGRLGLFIHVTAGFGDVGFAGYWTLEIFCVQPIRIYPDVQICQIYYHTIQGEYQKYDSGKYQNNTGVQPSMLYKDFLREDGSSK